MRKVVTITLLVFILAQLLTISCTSTSPAKGSVLGSEVVYGNRSSCYSTGTYSWQNPSPRCKDITLHVTVQNIGGDGIVTVYARVNYTVDYAVFDNVRYRETEVYLKQGQQNTVIFPFWVPEEWTYETGTP
jgi:hypothetical protein